ncbi:hypothetical protein U2I83_10400 [Bacillus amyloliquefaciens]|uniref:hypothetical protein n=1 Tax=Bacillus amyloliquefaciens TaxID=1390 RepID=UPI0032DEBD88
MLVSELYPCLICGFKGLETSPVYNGEYQKTFDICPCCGFEFGYSEDHDVSLGFIVTPDHLIEAAFQLYRKQWIEGGMKLFSPNDVPAECKNEHFLTFDALLKQLKGLNLNLNNFDINGFYDE